MFWKTGYSQVEFNSADFLERKIQESFPSKQTPRGANSAKISKIVEKLCPHMDLIKRKFWIDLPCNELSLDLQNTRDKNEEDVDSD